MSTGGVSISDAQLSKREIEEAALVCARAFHTDPLFAYLSPGAMLRSRGLAIYSRAAISNLGPKGRLVTARRHGALVGVAGWVAPGGYPYPAATQARLLFGALRAMVPRPPALVDGLRYLSAVERAHTKEECWFLQMLATDPEHQRRGVGTALLEGVLAECDDLGVPAYLETQKEANLAYYGRFGFEVLTQLRPVQKGPPLWTLQRRGRDRS